jgi:hypothetical protein
MDRCRTARPGPLAAAAGMFLALVLAACSGSPSMPSSAGPATGSASAGPGSAAGTSGATVAPASAGASDFGPTDAAPDKPTMVPTTLPSASILPEETPVMGGPGGDGSGTGGSAEPSLGRDAELEARLPRTLDGKPVAIQSTLGVDLSPDADPSLRALLDTLGVGQAALSVATGWSEDGSWDGQVGAFRVRGAQTDRILGAFIDAAGVSSEKGLTVTHEVVGGRAAVRVVNRDSPEQGPMYVVASGDTVYFVQSTTTRIVSEALAAFPK